MGMTLLCTLSQVAMLLLCIAISSKGQLMTSDQKNVIEAQTDQRFQFDTNFVRAHECQCSQLLRNSDEWIAMCRLCFDYSLASTIRINVVIDEKTVATWKTFEDQGCTFSEYGKTQFTTISCNKTLRNKVIHLNFRLKPTNEYAIYDKVMCGAEATGSSNKKGNYYNWGDGGICYRESGVDATSLSTPNGELDVIMSANPSLDDTSAGISTEDNEAFLGITYRQMKICGMVFVAALLLICISAVIVRRDIKRRRHSTKRQIQREESTESIVGDSYGRQVTASSEYETLKTQDNDCASYTIPSNENLTEIGDSSNALCRVAATEVNTGNSQIYQQLSESPYCHLDDYESIDPGDACYAQLVV